MAVPEIGVKISPQGLEQVIAALSKVRTTGVTAAADTAAGFDLASASVGVLDTAVGALETELAGVMAFLAPIAAVAAFGHLISGALDAEEAIGKLSQKTGGSAETLSTLAMVAGDVGVDIDQLGGGLVKLAKNQQDAANGAAKPAAAFKALGITLKDLQTLDPASLFLKMSEKLNAMPDGAQKTNLAMATMGKAAAELLPVMDELGVEGFQKATEKAKELGLLLDKNTIAAARAAKQDFRELGDVAQGLATRFANGVAPYLAQGMEEFAKAVEGGGVDSMQKFGEESGKVFKYIVAGAILAKDIIVTAFVGIKEEVSYYTGEIKAMYDAVKSGGISGSGDRAIAAVKGYESKNRDAHEKTMWANSNAFDAQWAADKAKMATFIAAPPAKRTFKDTPTGSGGAVGNGVSEEQAQKVSDARAKYLESAADNELAILKASNTLKEEEDKRSYEAGLLTLDEYYDRRAARIKVESDAELAILEKKREDALHVTSKDAADTKETKLQRKVDNGSATLEDYKELEAAQKAETQATEVQDATESKLAQNRLDRTNAVHALSLKEMEDIRKLQEMSGDKFGAEETALQEEIQKYAELLKAQNKLSPVDQAKAVKDYKDKGEGRIEFQRQDQKGSQGLQAMNEEISDVQSQASNGSINQLTATAKILAIEKERLPVLMDIAQAELAAAQKDGTPEDIAKAKQYIQTLKGIKDGMTDATTAQTYFYNQLETKGVQAMEGFFTSWLDGTKSFKDSLKDLADAFEEMVAQMIAKMLLLYTIELLVGWITGGNTDDIAAVTKMFGLGSHAEGGFTANVPANQVAGIVHGQEWVATADQTRKYKSLFTAISSGQALPMGMAGSAVASPASAAQPMDFASRSASSASPDSVSASATSPDAMQDGAGAVTPAPIYVNINNTTGQPAAAQQTTGPGGHQQIEIMVGQMAVKAVVTNMAQGGQVAKQMEGQYGLARSGVRRG